MPEHSAAAQRILQFGAVSDAVAVTAPQGGEPCVESGGRQADGAHHDGRCRVRSVDRAGGCVGRQIPVDGCLEAPLQGRCGIDLPAAAQGGPLRRIQVDVGDLTAGVDAGVGPAGHREADVAPEKQLKPGFDGSLNGRQTGLDGPSREGTAVVRKIDPDTQMPAIRGRDDGHLFVHVCQKVRRRTTSSRLLPARSLLRSQRSLQRRLRWR